MYAQPRNRLADLLRIAAELGVELTPRMRRDWTGLGFLAPATPEGKPGESGGGVLRYWTPEQTDVFRVVLARYAERLPRYKLANVPVAFWLLPFDGENCVPLVQLRRALATFATAAWSEPRLVAMVRRGVLDVPKVKAADPELRERVEGLVEHDCATRPQGADSAWLADRLTARTGVDRANEARIREASEAGLRGLASFRDLDDDAYRGARMRYRYDYLRVEPSNVQAALLALDDGPWPLPDDPPRVSLSRGRPDVLAENACADLLTMLGRIAGERGLA